MVLRVLSYIKSTLYLLILISLGLYVYKERNFIRAIYEITQFESIYYEKILTDDGIKYVKTDVKPTDWVPIKKISKNIKGAMIVSEDGKFYHHPGYDLESLRDRVYDTFVLKKKELKGGSTITQQLVKNLYLNGNKTLGRKSRELILAMLIEKYASKEKILEAYLNVIEYGKNLYGIQDASKFYFKKSPDRVNPREAAFLAMLLPNPKRYSRSFKSKILSRYARRTVDSILLRMRQNAYIGENEYAFSLSNTMNFEKQTFGDNFKETSGLDYKKEEREDLSAQDKEELQSFLKNEHMRL